MKITPAEGQILIEAIQETETPGGIVLPEQASYQEQMGIIRAIGKGEQMRDGNRFFIPYSPGDVVQTGSTAPFKVQNRPRRDLFIIRVHDILARIEYDGFEDSRVGETSRDGHSYTIPDEIT